MSLHTSRNVNATSESWQSVALSALSFCALDGCQDLDFFAQGIEKRDAHLLIDAAKAVREQSSARLPEDWINRRTLLFIKPPLRKGLTEEGLKQDEVIFQAPGLTIYAAPWAYAFVSKLHRIAGKDLGESKIYDPLDAANCLNRYLRKVQATQIRSPTIAKWLQHYMIRIPQVVFSKSKTSMISLAQVPTRPAGGKICREPIFSLAIFLVTLEFWHGHWNGHFSSYWSTHTQLGHTESSVWPSSRR